MASSPSEAVCASAASWQYIAEGALNLALRYTGSAPALRGTVLRVRKLNPEASGAALSGPGVSSPWVESLRFVDTVVLPLLGRRYVQPATEVPLRAGFMDELAAHIEDARPQARRKHGLDLSLETALLMLDNTALPLPLPLPLSRGAEAESATIAGAPAPAPAVCFELKVKCGFVPAACPLVTLDVKKTVSRFQMHQQLKSAQGKLDTLSRYSPLDLFSYELPRVVAALDALVDTPQNNFRMFVDGQMAYPDAKGHGSRAELAALLGQHGVAGGSVVRLVGTLAGVLVREPLMGRLRAMQSMDDCDIEGVWPAYQAIVARGEQLQSLADGPPLLPREAPREAPRLPAEQHAAVRRFMLSCTGKDCSVMIVTRASATSNDAVEAGAADAGAEAEAEADAALGVLPAEDDKKEGRTVVEGFEGVDYSIAIVDLDPKPIAKMQHYFELDQEIAKHYQKALDEGRLL